MPTLATGRLPRVADLVEDGSGLKVPGDVAGVACAGGGVAPRAARHTARGIGGLGACAAGQQQHGRCQDKGSHRCGQGGVEQAGC